MENKKDLSKAFAIIFGIKPEEVPSKSSGVESEKLSLFDIMADLLLQDQLKWLSANQTKVLKDAGDSTYEKALNDKESIVKDSGKFYRDEERMKELYDKIDESVKEKQSEFVDKLSNILSNNVKPDDSRLYDLNLKKKNMIENDKELNSLAKDFLLNPTKDTTKKLDNALSDKSFPLEEWKYLNLKREELEKYSNMENSNKALEEYSKLGQKESEKLESMRDLAEGVGLLPISLQDKEYRDLKSSDKADKDQANDYDYVVTFKDERLAPLVITDNMFESLNMHYARNNYNSTSTLLFASDRDTGEMICLDSSSILSITKFK